MNLKKLTKYIKEDPKRFLKELPGRIKSLLSSWKNRLLYTFLPRHKKEQIPLRVLVTRESCLNEGSCPCGCPYQGVVMSDYACGEFCFEDLEGREAWELTKEKIDLKTIKSLANERLRKYPNSRFKLR